MTWIPIAATVPQYVDSNGDPYNSAVLKAYEDGTTTNINFATDESGATTVSSIALDSNGNPAVSGSVVIPHVEEKFKLALYPTQADADADTGAIWTVDDITPSALNDSSAAIKLACVCASTANLSLSSEQTIDGITTSATRILVKDQTDKTENGIYVTSAAAWTREPDFDGTANVVEGTMVPVNRGTANSNTIWRVSNTGTITIGTTELTFTAQVFDAEVENMAALLVSPTTAGVVYVQGFRDANDWGGGHFFWDSSQDKANHDGGTIIDPDNAADLSTWNEAAKTTWFTAGSGTGCWMRIYTAINDRMFGADDTTDNTQPIDASIAAALTVDGGGTRSRQVNSLSLEPDDFVPGEYQNIPESYMRHDFWINTFGYLEPDSSGNYSGKDTDIPTDQKKLTFTGSITIVDGETLTQATSGATGEVVNGGTVSSIWLINITGTFNTANELTGSTSGALGANSVPTLVSNQLRKSRSGAYQMYLQANHSGQGDGYNLFSTTFVTAGSQTPITEWGGQTSGGLGGGSAKAATANVNLYGYGDIVCQDNSKANVSMLGSVIILYHDNTDADSYNIPRINYLALSEGAEDCDAAYSIKGDYLLGMDFSSATYSSNAAITLAQDQWIAFDATSSSGIEGKFSSQTVGTTYMHFDGTDIVLTVGGTTGAKIKAQNMDLPAASGTYQVNGTTVLKAQIATWTATTGTELRTNFGDASLSDTSQALRALIVDLKTHGLIGNV